MKPNEILMFGKGWLGTRISTSIGCYTSDRRISKLSDIQAEIDRYNPKAIINCIGHFGNNVDECENNKEKTMFSNTYVPILMAEAAKRNNLKLIHVSSGCLFHYNYNDAPITEDKDPDFFDLFYCRAKIYAEQALMSMKDTDILILRPRMPLDTAPHKRNLLNKLTGFKRIINIPNSVTYIPDFIEGLKHLIRVDAKGIYNMVSSGALTLVELADKYKKYNKDFTYEIVDMNKLKIVRTNILLSTDKLASTGFKVRDIHECVDECINTYVRGQSEL